MTRHEFVRRFITVHKCGGCGEIIDYENSDDAFCAECRLDYWAARADSCMECFKAATECSCMPRELSRSGALCYRKLFFYDTEKQDKPRIKLLYHMKNNKSRRITNFVSDELLPLLKEEIDTLDAPAERLLLTYVPRSKSSETLMGFDQSRLLVKMLSEKTGIEYARVFAKKRSSGKQKELNSRQRINNASRNTTRKGRVDVSGKYVILVDDIVTTGASMSVCVKMLMRESAAGVICLSVAGKNKK